MDKNRNATVAMVERMQKHVSSSLKKISGEFSQSETDPSRDPSSLTPKTRIELKFQKRKHQRQLRDEVPNQNLLKKFQPKNV